MTIQRQANFYSPWPLIGVKLSNQWRNLRINHEESKATIRSALLDIDDSEDYFQQDRALTGMEFGQHDFKNKFRWIYQRSNGHYILQRNDGTTTSPEWVNLIDVPDSGVAVDVTAAFLRVSAGTTSFYQVTHLKFNTANGFYLTSDSSGNPVVNTTQIGRATRINFSTSSVEWQANHNFGEKPLFAQAYDIHDKLIQHDKIDLIDVSDPNTTYFYFSAAQHGYATLGTGGIGTLNIPEVRVKEFAVTTPDVEWQLQHNLSKVPVSVDLYDLGYRYIVADEIDVSDPNITYFYFSSATSGRALIKALG